jgi:phage terminase small subunit
MARQSAEDRAAAYWRARGKPPAPPSHLSPKARKLWREIVASRPPELFAPGSTELLAQFCELSIQQQGYLTWLREDPRNPEIQQTVCRVGNTLCQLATKLRLALTSIDRKAGILAEREPEVDDKDDTLFGGNVAKLKF